MAIAIGRRVPIPEFKQEHNLMDVARTKSVRTGRTLALSAGGMQDLDVCTIRCVMLVAGVEITETNRVSKRTTQLPVPL